MVSSRRATRGSPSLRDAPYGSRWEVCPKGSCKPGCSLPRLWRAAIVALKPVTKTWAGGARRAAARAQRSDCAGPLPRKGLLRGQSRSAVAVSARGGSELVKQLPRRKQPKLKAALPQGEPLRRAPLQPGGCKPAQRPASEPGPGAAWPLVFLACLAGVLFGPKDAFASTRSRFRSPGSRSHSELPKLRVFGPTRPPRPRPPVVTRGTSQRWVSTRRPRDPPQSRGPEPRPTAAPG